MRLFIPVVGQFTNIGDTLHRKILISWLKKDEVSLHIYVGKAPRSFVDALQLNPNDKIYSNIYKWLFHLVFSGFLSKKALVFNPGEMTFSSKRLKSELLLFPFYLYLKLTGGIIIRPGVAVKSDLKLKNKKIWNFILKLSKRIYWRTNKSAQYFRLGNVIPDLAFYNVDPKINFDNKSFLTISMRGDRKFPTEKWFNAVNEFCILNKLQIKVVSQVRMDNDRTIEIAKNLKAEYFIWEDSFSHNRQEEIVNKIYDHSKLVVSDRLHVLISAYTKGCIPANILTEQSNKVQDHFDVIQLNNVSLVESQTSHTEIVGFLENKIREGFDTKKMYLARERLESTKNEIERLIFIN